MVRTAVIGERCLSYGVGIPDSAPYLLRARTEGIPTVRRSTGGTGLLHEPGDLLWSIVLPRADPRVGRGFVRAYGRLGSGVVEFLADRGVPAEWTDPPGVDAGYCTLSARGWVLSSRRRILGGAAQHLTANALLHHGAISSRVDRPAIDRLFGLASGGPSSRLHGMQDLGVRAPPEELAAALARWVAQALAADPAR